MDADHGQVAERAMILVSDSALTMVLGGKRNPERTSPSDTFQAYLSDPTWIWRSANGGQVGARLIQLVGRVEVIMDEIVDATGNRFAAMVVWSGNELVGSQGVFCSPDPIAGRIGLASHGRHSQHLEWDFASAQSPRWHLASPTVWLCQCCAWKQCLPIAFNDLNEYFAGEARQYGIHTLDIKQMLDRAEFKDHCIFGKVMRTGGSSAHVSQGRSKFSDLRQPQLATIAA